MKTKWGVWGSSGIARRRTIPEGIAKASNAELTHVYCRTKDINREIAATFGAEACADESELLTSDCDVIYIATPVDLHSEEVTRCAEAGKHVFCEKPLGRAVAEAQGIVDTCRSHGVKLGVGLMMRFQAQHVEALRMVAAGRIGSPVLGRAQLSCWYPPIEGAWRQDPARGGGGSLMDMGSHCIDLLEMYFGRTRLVRCITGRLVHDYASEDTAIVALEFETGAKGMVDVLFNVPDASSRNRLELYGSRGSILAEGTIGQDEAGEMVAHLEEGEGGYDAQQSRDASGGSLIAPDPVNVYRAEVEAFTRAVVDDAEPPVGGEAGLWNQRVVAAAYESAETGKAVTV